MMKFSRRKKPATCRITAKYLFARAFFKNVRPEIQIGIIAGRKQVKNYMSGTWWNKDPVITARNIHINWGVAYDD
ncbi:hypothetical protein CYG68_06320 [Morganella morganii]|uniref:Uncharacterized protein n=1 Tax=Morganella morganii TaxID=582 RepID=A0A8I0PTH7_MORMO|nr:hypothetical protein [Morganella morganii]MBE8612033.1 hypothetical protein [Morganella morganii]